MLDATVARLMVQSLDGGAARVVLASATDGRLLPSGRLAFMRLGTLMTTNFDLARAEVIGDPVAALGGVMQSGLRRRASANNTGAGMFAVSSRGDLAVVRGSLTGGEVSPMVWVTRDGGSSSAEPTSGAPVGARLYSRISPDRSRAAVTIITPTRFELWLADWKRNIWNQCMDCSGDSLLPFVWAPDGEQLLLPRFDALVAHSLDGSTPDNVVVRESDRLLSPRAWLADGRIVYESEFLRFLGVEHREQAAGRRSSRRPCSGAARHWCRCRSVARQPLARVPARQTGQPSYVVVQHFPNPGARTVVSAAGGQNPVWSADGRMLYYLTSIVAGGPEARAFAVDTTTTERTFTAGTPGTLPLAD